MPIKEKKTKKDKNIDYNKLLHEGGLFFSGPSKGSFILPPNGLKLWQNIQKILDEKFAKYKVENVKLPTLIPYSLFQKETQHIQGFSPEFFQVLQIGKKELTEPLILRPTSELLFYDWFRQILRSYQQLPLLYNQWCQVFRAEKNTKPFLRNTEFFWQEGHTLHETALEAQEFTQKIWQEYQNYVEKTLCLATITGRKSKKEKFAGAIETYAVECLLPDGQCLQLATSHYFGDSFCRAMDVKFQGKKQNKKEQLQYPFSTSWGTSTRTIGALVLSHTDNLGLILPFDVAPVQIAFILVRESKELISYYQEVRGSLSPYYRCQLYDNFSQADKEGCPFKIILGPKELKKREITLKRRDNTEPIITISLVENETEKKYLPLYKNFLEKTIELNENRNKKKLEETKEEVISSLQKSFWAGKIIGVIAKESEELKKNIYQKSAEFRDNHIFQADNFSELENKIKNGKKGLFLIPFCNKLDCEKTIPYRLPAYSIRCLAEKNDNNFSLSRQEHKKMRPVQKKCIFCLSFTTNLAFLGRSY